MPDEIKFTPHPINIIDVEKIVIPKNNSMPKSPIQLGTNSTFLLTKNEEVVYAIINGFVYHIVNDKNNVLNGIVK